MLDLPTIRLELDGMRYQVVHALAKHNQEMQDLVSEETKRVIEQMDWRGEIAAVAAREIQSAVSKSVERFFSYGDGRALVDEYVKASFVGLSQEESQEQEES